MGEDNNQGILNQGFYNPLSNNLCGNNWPPNNVFVLNHAFDDNGQVIQNEGAEQFDGDDFDRHSPVNSMRLHNNVAI